MKKKRSPFRMVLNLWIKPDYTEIDARQALRLIDHEQLDFDKLLTAIRKSFGGLGVNVRLANDTIGQSTLDSRSK